MTEPENAAILLLSEALNRWGDHCRQVEAALIEMHLQNDRLRARIDKRDAGDLSNVNA